MRLKYRTNEEGFVLLESLISLVILVMVLIVTLPFIVDLLSFRNKQKENVELARVVYEVSFLWRENVEEQQWQSGENTYTVYVDSSSIQVKEGNRNESQLDVLHVEFK